MKFYHRLRTKLISVLILVALIPAMVTGIYAMHVSIETLRNQTLNTQIEHAKTLKSTVESFLSVAREDLLFLSESVPLKEYLNMKSALADPDDASALSQVANQVRLMVEQEFLSFSRNRRIYYQIRYLDETGQERVRIDSDGLRSKAIPQDRLQNKADRYYFKDTMSLSSQRVFVSPLDLNRERGQIEVPHKPVIRYAVKVYDGNRRKAGIVILNVDANKFLKQLDDIRLVTQEGFFATHPEAEKRWGSQRDLNTGYDIKTEYGELGDQFLAQDGTYSDDKVTIAHQRITVPGSPRQWTLILQRSTKNILKNVTLFQITFAVILLLTVLTALVFALLFSTKITRPIEYLTHLADSISKGNLIDNRIEIDDKSEIGQLAKAFERMRVSMLKSFERIRRQSSKG